MPPTEAVEAIRRSAKRLEEIREISDKLVMPVHLEAEQPPNITERQPELVVVSETGTMNAYLHSPIPSVALTPLTPSPAILLQAMSINRPSFGLDWLLLKPPDGVSFKQCLHDAMGRGEGGY